MCGTQKHDLSIASKANQAGELAGGLKVEVASAAVKTLATHKVRQRDKFVKAFCICKAKIVALIFSGLG